MALRSSSGVLMGMILNFSTSTLRTLGETKAGRLGPSRMFFTPRKSSVSKIKRMLQARCIDGRCRGNFQYMGAASTARWAGRGIQLQNMPRPKLRFKDIEQALRLLGT